MADKGKSTKSNNTNSKSAWLAKISNALHKVLGGLNMSWPVVIGFAVAMGIYTALMALLVPDGNSFHDIAVTPEWWVLPAILVIVNCKKPLDAALKVFVFFLISQPLVYLIQVPFHSMGWSLFQYYPYWFKITLLTFPAGFIGWYLKKDEWYSGIILSVMTSLLVYIAISYINGFGESFPNHLITVMYCLGIIPVFIIGIFRKWQPRVISFVITLVVALTFAFLSIGPEKFEAYRNNYDGVDGMTMSFEFGENPYISFFSGTANGDAELINAGEGVYTLKLTGLKGGQYRFAVTDEAGNEQSFRYYFDDSLNTLIVRSDEN